MHTLAVVGADGSSEASIQSAQWLAARIGGAWSVLQLTRWVPSDILPFSRGRRIERLKKDVLETSAADRPPSSIIVGGRDIVRSLERSGPEGRPDLVVLDVDQVKKTGTQDALANILRPSLPPVLVVYDRIVAPPRSLALVIEARDSGPEIVRHAAEQVLEMGFPLAASGQDGLTPMHVIVGIGAGFDWWEERAALAGEMNDGLGSLGIAPGAPWPTLVRHIPGALRLLEPELVVLLSDPVTVDGKARMRRVADYALRSMTPVLALTSGRVPGPLDPEDGERERNASRACASNVL